MEKVPILVEVSLGLKGLLRVKDQLKVKGPLLAE